MQESDPKDQTLIEEEPEPSTSKAPIPVKAYFFDALAQMPSYAKFMKDILSNKRKLEKHETVMLMEECSAIFQKKLPPKIKDLGSFTISCTIGDLNFSKVLCDLGANINLMPLSIFRKLGLGEAKATTISLQLADRSIKYPRGVIEDVLVKVDKFIFLADFIILDMEEDHDIPIILGRSSLATGRALIDVQEGQLILRVQDEKVTFNILKAIKYPSKSDSCLRVDVVDHVVAESFYRLSKDPLEICLVCPSAIKEEDPEVEHMVHYLEATPSRSYKRAPNYEDLEKSSSPPLPSLQ
ncbi:uncharacterized protein LOC111397759 [Olea europaea var. sylvestris]|uniref:uncharacterized protein LOC111397759 n=1 Tax=Olea europaea var. sylvestris TaxID=158386 RepID=UPI000C1D16F2|nr:uncharacterized protein LOC111397759 [Olea europaea var. sylvestris]